MATTVPPPVRTSRKGEPPTKSETKKNLETPDMNKIVPLNFRVPAEFKREFRIAAAKLDTSLSELLQRTFIAWQEKNK